MRAPPGIFNTEQLGVLETSFERACNELGIDPADTKNRETVAEAMMDLAKAGQYDPDRLIMHAVSRILRRGEQAPVQ